MNEQAASTSRPVPDRAAIAAELAHAVSRGELRLHYQPQFCLSDRRLVAFEALSRWSSPVLGEVEPEIFIPIAEETGLLHEIGRWSISRALSQVSTVADSAFRIAVNVSAMQLGNPDFADDVARILHAAGFPPERLELEVTERTCLLGTPGVGRSMGDLRTLGVSLALDDFGAGHNNLVVLGTFEFDRLKLDRSLLASQSHSAKAGQIIEWVISMAQALELEVIAEGVETAAQDDFLRKAGCNIAQGFLYAHAMPFEVAIAGLAKVAPVVGIGPIAR